CAKGTKYW
nr:immunoglobulin heavy chain junction region [Macaca mulatta]MOV47922.1 immunoglobulin heavy chain junction region [Macaca mulatta]MOV47960.1 immunoglobulin heavy chain junction region [Macaca mulatta]MOV48011.1 immunoglobulin heavy chain junction region [Macaca mulatta]MOV48047.1 immunoglobulin heavy chain junction region [Macaca mulatta]